MSTAHKGSNNPRFGKPAWNKGKYPSPETRAKQSVARKGKAPWNKGIKNQTWVVNAAGKSRLILPHQIKELLDQGFVRGRSFVLQ